MRPWDDWYHCTAHTYGTWLRGDPRGWRARHHREHVEGDYKHPPPKGKYDEVYARAKALMKRDPVKLHRDLCDFVLDAVVRRILEQNVEVVVAAFDGVHLHALLRCPKHDPRIVLGIAKQYATAQLKAHALAPELKLGEGIWGKKSHPTPIADVGHWFRAFDYVRDHGIHGAAVWQVPCYERFPNLSLFLQLA